MLLLLSCVLLLVGNSLGDMGAVALGQALLQPDCSLETLILSRNHIDVSALTDVLLHSCPPCTPVSLVSSSAHLTASACFDLLEKLMGARGCAVCL